MNSLNLDAINEAFGTEADLYTDVLLVKANASSEQIQRAYFDRRNELFELLADLESTAEQDSLTATRRFQAERKMDAVVMTLRILGDVGTRADYDDVRVGRVGTRSVDLPEAKALPRTSYNMDAGDIPMKPKSVLKKSSYNISQSQSDDENAMPASNSLPKGPPSPDRSTVSSKFSMSTGTNTLNITVESTATPVMVMMKPEKQTRKTTKRKARRVSPEIQTRGRRKKADESVAQESDMEESIYSAGSLKTMETTLTTYETNRGFFQTIQDEIMGALDDTSQSFHQVFSVFTLREEEIEAVTGRIDKARRQMVHSFAK